MYESRGRKRPNVAIKNSPLLCSVVDQLVKNWEFIIYIIYGFDMKDVYILLYKYIFLVRLTDDQ